MTSELPRPHLLPVRTFLQPWSSKEAPTCAIRDLANPAGVPQRFSLARSWPQKSHPWGLVEALGASREPLFGGRHQRRHKRALWQGLPGGSDWEVTDEEGWVGESGGRTEDPLQLMQSLRGAREREGGGESASVFLAACHVKKLMGTTLSSSASCPAFQFFVS